MPRYRVVVRPNHRLTYYVEAATPEEAEQKAHEHWSDDAEPDEFDADGPDVMVEEIEE